MSTSLDRLRTWALGLWATLALLYLFIPIGVIALFSFNDNQGRFNYTWQGFTLRHWEHPFSVQGLGSALTTSLSIAALATLFAVTLGTGVALALVRHRLRGRAVVDGMVLLPLATPDVVLGAALLGYFLTLALARGIRHDPDRPHDVHARLRGADGPRAPGGHGPAHRGGGDGPGRQPVDDACGASRCR